jgi:hypothetical protein
MSIYTLKNINYRQNPFAFKTAKVINSNTDITSNRYIVTATIGTDSGGNGHGTGTPLSVSQYNFVMSNMFKPVGFSGYWETEKSIRVNFSPAINYGTKLLINYTVLGPQGTGVFKVNGDANDPFTVTTNITSRAGGSLRSLEWGYLSGTQFGNYYATGGVTLNGSKLLTRNPTNIPRYVAFIDGVGGYGHIKSSYHSGSFFIP